ncbi:sigma-E processing peptidase SpoIIGA [Alkaliphilus transvaalensis]|uniref:sigma-E processing peptidase SpoIIGA n=1 Tax=Alkaliphilus transvaalensis TaxID=114628 RepID=UPI00047B9E6B|nr:sigma-E processing peptidase SpoIIGA [Alkaliphilus transvaalensis]
MIVYAEYVFLENFIMNFIILSLTSKFGKTQTKKVRLLMASSLGALYAFVLFFPSLHFLFSMMMKVTCSMLIIIIAFSPYRFKEFFRLLGIFYLITMVFGGAGFALFYFTSFNGIISNGIFYTTNITLKNLMLSCGLAYILINFCWGYIQKQLSRDKIYMKVKIQMNGENVELKGLVDTGNSLKDPLTSHPVMIVEYNAIINLFPESIQAAFIGSKYPNFNEITMLLTNTPWMTRLRFIPFEALGTENGMLVGFKPDSVLIEKDYEIKNIENIIIAVYSKRLSKSGDYTALLHPDLV